MTWWSGDIWSQAEGQPHNCGDFTLFKAVFLQSLDLSRQHLLTIKK